LLHQAPDGRKDIFFIDTEFASLLKVVGEYVEEELRVGRSIDVPVRGSIEEMQQGRRVNQIAILQRIGSISKTIRVDLYPHVRIQCRKES
jgi:hypothetical protein